MNREKLRMKVDELLSMKKCDEVESVLTENHGIAKSDRDLFRVYYMIPICTAEREEGRHTLFSKVSSVDALLERETRLKFYLRRIAFDLLDDEKEFYQFCSYNQVSLAELFVDAYCNAIHKEKVQGFIQSKMAEGKLVV
ncbi:MAG: hypothetical protein K2O40_02905 [Lachnospiraceae bacterium]|nr:hypothetical protein [Lachnospiraceae bacterium]